MSSKTTTVTSTLARRKLVAVAAAASLGFGFTLISFWPGYLSSDSILQLLQARSGQYDPWFPPIMSWIWRFTDHIAPGPLGMLVLHNLLFWSGIGLLVHHTVRRPTVAFLAILTVGLLPPVLALLSTVWKDVGLGVSLVLAFALLLVADERRSLLGVVLALPLLFYATAVRYNGAAAVLPLALWAGSTAAARLLPMSAYRRSIGLAVGVLLLASIVALALTINGQLAGGRLPETFRAIFVQDTVAITLATGGRIPPPGSVRSIGARWRQTVTDHPGAYLRYRGQTYALLLGIGSAPVCYPFQEGTDDPKQIVPLPSKTSLNRWVMAYLEAVKNSVLFRAWLYLVLAVALPAVAWTLERERRLAALVLGASGVLYSLPYFFIAPDCDFRYNWWTVLAVVLLPFLLPSRLEEAVRSSGA